MSAQSQTVQVVAQPWFWLNFILKSSSFTWVIFFNCDDIDVDVDVDADADADAEAADVKNGRALQIMFHGSK